MPHYKIVRTSWVFHMHEHDEWDMKRCSADLNLTVDMLVQTPDPTVFNTLSIPTMFRTVDSSVSTFSMSVELKHLQHVSCMQGTSFEPLTPADDDSLVPNSPQEIHHRAQRLWQPWMVWLNDHITVMWPLSCRLLKTTLVEYTSDVSLLSFLRQGFCCFRRVYINTNDQLLSKHSTLQPTCPDSM